MPGDESAARVTLVRQRAGRAILDAIVGVREVPTAIGPERIERAIAEQAVELVEVNAFMTGKVRACAMREERVLVCRLLSHAPILPPPATTARMET